MEVFAADAAQAATKWADAYDSGDDYYIVGKRSEPVVTVINEEGNCARLMVSGEAAPQYYATPIV